MVVNMHDAKTKLSELVAAAERGEEIVIARNGIPAVRLVPVAAQFAPVRLGVLGGGIGPPPGFGGPPSGVGGYTRWKGGPRGRPTRWGRFGVRYPRGPASAR